MCRRGEVIVNVETFRQHRRDLVGIGLEIGQQVVDRRLVRIRHRTERGCRCAREVVLTGRKTVCMQVISPCGRQAEVRATDVEEDWFEAYLKGCPLECTRGSW